MRTFSVALVGPDGAGKTTVARELARSLPLPTAYLYMGVAPGSSNRLLPTTRVVHALRRRRGAGSAAPGGVGRRPGAVRALLRLANRVAEESYRQLLAEWHRGRGRVVLFDRHFFADYYSTDVHHAASLSRRLHGLFLTHVYPKPDLVVYLDAPAALLLARKGEGTLESLEALRRNYERLAQAAPAFVRIDASRDLERVVEDAIDAICEFAERRGHGRLAEDPQARAGGVGRGL
jgi:thymidylate kinase